MLYINIMEFSYYLGEFNGDDFVIRFDDGRFINMDLGNDFPNYKLPYNNLACELWHFTAIKNYGNNLVKLGDVKLFERDEVRKINTLCTKFFKEKVLYRLTTQTELDKYESTLDPITDNGKLYLFILDSLEKEKMRKLLTSDRPKVFETMV